MVKAFTGVIGVIDRAKVYAILFHMSSHLQWIEVVEKAKRSCV